MVPLLARVGPIPDLCFRWWVLLDVMGQCSDRDRRHFDCTSRAPSLWRTEVGFDTGNADELLTDIDLTLPEVHSLQFKAGDLRSAETAASGQVGDRRVALWQGGGQRVYLLGCWDVVTVARNAGQLHSRARRDADDPVDDSRIEHRGQVLPGHRKSGW